MRRARSLDYRLVKDRKDAMHDATRRDPPRVELNEEC